MSKKDAKIVLIPETELKKIGLRLKNLRKAKGYTNPDIFAYDHNLNRSQYGKYEAGRINITIGTLINILNHFEISLTDFFSEDYQI